MRRLITTLLLLAAPVLASDCIVQSVRAPVTHGGVVVVPDQYALDPSSNSLALRFWFDPTNTAADSASTNSFGIYGPAWATVGTNSFGRVEHGFSFDGTDDIMMPYTVPHSTDLYGLYAITVCAWIKPSQQVTWANEAIYSTEKYLGSANLGFTFTYNQVQAVAVINGVTGTALLSAPGSCTSNAWHHVAFVHTNGSQVLYVDGSAVTNAANAWTWTRSSADPSVLFPTVGAQYLGANRIYVFKGLIDDVRVYNRQLSAGEILSVKTLTNPMNNLETRP